MNWQEWLTPYNLIMVSFFIFAWSRALLRHREGKISSGVFWGWTAIWSLATYFLFLPNKSDLFARLLGETNGANAVFSIAIVFLLYSVYRIYVKIEEIHRLINRDIQLTSIWRSEEKNQVKSETKNGR